MIAGCRYDSCTVAETGRCALEQDPETCTYRAGNPIKTEPKTTNEVSTTGEDPSAPVLTSPDKNPSFPTSLTLGPDEVEKMMRSRYTMVVGILGDPESGKTACLASLYLLVANAMLNGWSFADSRSLMAFEGIARGARRWNEGNPPEQMTVHTEMEDERQPGFLHLRLRREADRRVFDFALPDLPGEWTKTLIRTARSDRFEFLKSTDVIWLVVDGRNLANRERRQGTIVRLGQLAGRLRALIEGEMPRVLVVVTHRDLYEPDPVVSAHLAKELAKQGIGFKLVSVAPFSDNQEFKPGFGLSELVSDTVGVTNATPDFWPVSLPMVGASSYLAYRRQS